jgi:hypothetical protein
MTHTRARARARAVRPPCVRDRPIIEASIMQTVFLVAVEAVMLLEKSEIGYHVIKKKK